MQLKQQISGHNNISLLGVINSRKYITITTCANTI